MNRKSQIKKTNQPKSTLLELLVTRLDAESKIGDRIEKGKELLNRKISSRDELETNRKDYYKWSEYNTELLKQLFSNSSKSEEYDSDSFAIFTDVGQPSLQDDINDLHKDIDKKNQRLESIKDRLELIPENQAASSSVRTSSPTPAILLGKAFIVHGHDEGVRETVARFLEKLRIEALILHEQATGGRTIIEKLERNSDVDFAIILLTPDDVGASASAQQHLSSRARQNVILELGYFVGKLGRNRVCAIYKGNIELPSDFIGVGYIKFDSDGGWRLNLAKELREAGFAVDLNKAI